jgi:16S rRNA C1402 (ribose-2'-O) methylase RsmI
VAADLRRELGISVETVPGHYGEFTVLVDDAPVVSGGSLAFLGILPTTQHVRETVSRHLDSKARSGAAGEP